MNALGKILKPCAGGLLHCLFCFLAMPGCDGSDSTSTSAGARAINALCNRVARCSNMDATVEFMQQCHAATGVLSGVLVDPETFGTCVDALSCGALSDESTIQACVDLDPTTIHCDKDSLLACTNAGVCKEIDCREACSSVGATYLECGLNPQYGYDTCQCTSK